MTPPTLKALSRHGLTSLEAAKLLQKHIGDGSSEWTCQQALAELRRLKNQSDLVIGKVTIRLFSSVTDLYPCEQVRIIIESICSLSEINKNNRNYD